MSQAYGGYAFKTGSTPSAALVDAWQDVGTNTTLHFRLALAATSTATGTTAVGVTYIQKR